MSTLFWRTLSQGVQAFVPVAVALAWWSRAGDAGRRSLVVRGAWLAAAITVPGSRWFQRSAARALDEAALAGVALAAAVACLIANVRRRDRRPMRSNVEPSLFAALAIVAATTVVVVRQTIEIGSVFEAAAFELRSRDATAVVVAAAAMAAGVVWTWTSVSWALSAGAVTVA